MAVIALSSSATGLTAQSTALDVIANNLANSNTTGFKASRVNFQDLLYSELQIAGAENGDGDRLPTATSIGLGVAVSGTQLDMRPGVAQNTERQLDVMIDGEGFFQMEIDDSIADGIGYTRAGNFAINADGEIVLANDPGRRLLPTITIPPDALQIEISTDGVVSVELPNQVNPTQVGTIQLATFVNSAGLRQIGENIFIPTAASGDPSVGDPGQDNRGVLRQGFLEGSNVDAVTELVNLVKTQRAFEFDSQAFQAADETLQELVNLRRF